MLPISRKGSGAWGPVSNRIRNGLLQEIELEASRRPSAGTLLLRLKQNLSALAVHHPSWVRADAAWAAWCEITERGGWEPGSRAWEGPRQLLMTYGQNGETGDATDFLDMFSEAVESGVRVWPLAVCS